MTAADIGQDVFEQIAMLRKIPQMVVRVDNLEGGLQDRLVGLGEPCLVHAHHA